MWKGWLMKWFGWFGQFRQKQSSQYLLRSIGCITKVLCSLLLNTWSKDTGATRIGQTTFGGETGPTPASQGHGDTIKQSFFVIQWICYVGIWESDKLSHLTGRTLGDTKKLFDPICDIRHPHKMIFVEPSHIFFDEMTGNCDEHLAFELGSLPRVSKVTICIVTLFSLASEIRAKLFRHVLGENVQRVDWRIPEVEHSQFFFLFGSSINLHPGTKLLLLLRTKGNVLIRIRCCRFALASVTLFGSGSSVGNGTRCTICKGISFILPWSVGLGVILGTEGVGSNRPWHDHISGHGSLMQVDLGAKCLQYC